MRESQVEEQRVLRSFIVGTLEQYPDRAAAEIAADAIRLSQNQPRPTTSPVLFGALIERYLREALPERYSTQSSYRSCIRRHLLPRWNTCPLQEMAENPYAVEQWLLALKLAPKTKSHLKAILHRVFEYAMKWRIVPLQRNPMSLVEVKGGSKRRRRPTILKAEHCFAMLAHLAEPYRTMVLVAICLGLRVSEILALRWSDFDFAGLTLLVQRGVVHGRVDEVKTEYSADELPLDPLVAAALLDWKARCSRSIEGWVFANPVTHQPYHASPIQQDYLRKLGRQLGLGEHIGWHTFRHSYRAWLDAAGTPLGVQQKLMRHASITTTMNVYGNALLESKRAANSKVVQLLQPALVPRKAKGLLASGPSVP